MSLEAQSKTTGQACWLVQGPQYHRGLASMPHDTMGPLTDSRKQEVWPDLLLKLLQGQRQAQERRSHFSADGQCPQNLCGKIRGQTAVPFHTLLVYYGKFRRFCFSLLWFKLLFCPADILGHNFKKKRDHSLPQMSPPASPLGALIKSFPFPLPDLCFFSFSQVCDASLGKASIIPMFTGWDARWRQEGNPWVLMGQVPCHMQQQNKPETPVSKKVGEGCHPRVSSHLYRNAVTHKVQHAHTRTQEHMWIHEHT